MAEEYTDSYFNSMQKLGYKKEEIAYVVSNKFKAKREEDKDE